MSGRRPLLWLLSALLLAWMGVLTMHTLHAERCAADGGRWEWRAWSCEPSGREIHIGRDLRRT